MIKKANVLLISIFMVSGALQAQQNRPLYEIYSMMVFNFTKHVQWPDHSTTGEFVIGVIGNTDVYQTLDSWYGGKPRGGKTYVIRKFANASEVTQCHVLFIDKTKSSEFEEANARLKGKGSLIITDKHGLGAKGSAINFKTIDNKLKFELNQKAMETANLKVSSSLSSMAILI
jgi:hypothetical protein